MAFAYERLLGRQDVRAFTQDAYGRIGERCLSAGRGQAVGSGLQVMVNVSYSRLCDHFSCLGLGFAL